MYKQDVRCQRAVEHNFHHHTVLVVEQCSGKTDCGQYSHAPHDLDIERDVWCPGICGCGLDGLHGPGAHK